MRALVTISALVGALMLPATALAAGASGAGRGSAAATTLNGGVDLPVMPVRSATIPPPGFTSNALQAIAAAKATHVMQALHRRMHPLQIHVFVTGDRRWSIYFSYRDNIVADVEEDAAGQALGVYTGPLAVAGYARGHYAPEFDSWWVVVPFSVLFLVPFLDPRRLRRMAHLDALVVLSFLLSYWLFDHGHLEFAVWLVYPPLLYLLVRMIRVGLRSERQDAGLSPWLSPKILVSGLLLLVAGRVALSLTTHLVIDVGYASVVGAYKIVHGLPIYYSALAHPDTYGPIAYLAYVPFELLFPWHGSWDYLPAAHAASIVFDLGTIAGLVALGRRLRAGRDGVRLGLALGWAWAACPFTLLGLTMHSNDGLIAMLSVLSLLVFASPAARGALLGLATAAKFSPAALLPLFAGRRDRGLRGALVCAGAFAAVTLGTIWLYLPAGGVSEFYNHTLGFQISRTDVFSPWALHPGLAPVKVALEVAVAAFVLSLAWERRPRSLIQVSALAAAATIAVQLPAIHWFYYYIIWFAPFLFVALLGPASAGRPARPRDESRAVHEVEDSQEQPEPVLAAS